jgi:DNA-binding transcriptional LysR family regulator
MRYSPRRGVDEFRSWRVRLGVTMHPKHPLARQKSIRIRDCLQHPVALPLPGMELRTLLDRMMDNVRGTFTTRIESASTALMRSMAMENLALAFHLWTDVVRQVRAKSLVWLPLQDPAAVTSSAIYIRAGRSPSLAMADFLQRLETCLAEIGEPGKAPD